MTLDMRLVQLLTNSLLKKNRIVINEGLFSSLRYFIEDFTILYFEITLSFSSYSYFLYNLVTWITFSSIV